MKHAEFIEKKDEFLTHLEVERNLAENTLRAYESDLQQFIHFWERLSPTDQKNLTIRQIIERYLMVLFYKKMDKSSIARKFSCFKSFERFLSKQGIKLHLKLKRPRVDRKLPVFLSIEEMLHLLDNVQEDQLDSKFPIRDKAVLELLYATGVRCSELVNMRICDVDMKNKTIRIQGKGRKERLALFGNTAKQKLIRYFKYERAHVHDPNEPLFLNYRGKKLNPRSVQRIIQLFRPFLPVDRPISPHKIRHSFATHLLNQGADLRSVQELLGHSTLGSTEKYTHVTLSDLTTMCNTIHPLQTLAPKKDKS